VFGCGWILLFIIVIMPGIAKLDDSAFLRAFQVVDGIIQNNQPIFVFTWIGSAIALVICNIMGLSYYLDDDATTDKILLTVSTLLYLITQYTTFTKNVPLNNRVQTLDVANLDSFQATAERNRFEGSWNNWNVLRGVIMWVVTLYLLSLLLRI
jgi:uncharacterized membrane protein